MFGIYFSLVFQGGSIAILNSGYQASSQQFLILNQHVYWAFLDFMMLKHTRRIFPIGSCMLFKKNGGSWLFLHTSHRDLGDVTCVCRTSSSWILLCFDDLNFVFRIRGNMLKPFLELFKVGTFWAEYVWHLFSSLLQDLGNTTTQYPRDPITF